MSVLANGLTILCVPNHHIPQASVQLWYDVGSKDESDQQRGISHFIEHMIFKGTKTDAGSIHLSEYDIDGIARKLSAQLNACTSYDFTQYRFTLPSQHVRCVMEILADCMCHAAFNEQHMKSELKAVVQELKMYRDRYDRVLTEQMFQNIFIDHPYQYPIIGYKDVLCALTPADMFDYYHQHYIPNNATLVVVGDIKPDEIVGMAQELFGSIAPHWDYKPVTFTHTWNVPATSSVLYQDVQEPVLVYSMPVSGSSTGQGYVIDALSLIMGQGKGSRLYQKLVYEGDKAIDVSCRNNDGFDAGFLEIEIKPHSMADEQNIKEQVVAMLNDIACHGVTDEEVLRAHAILSAGYADVIENNEQLALAIGNSFLATKDPQYINTIVSCSPQVLHQQIDLLVKQYLNPAIIHEGKVVPFIDAAQKEQWQKAQHDEDDRDKELFAHIQRTDAMQAGNMVNMIQTKPCDATLIFDSHKVVLDNGLKLIISNQSDAAKIEIIFDSVLKSYYDPDGQEGLIGLLYRMLEEGTQNYSAQELAMLMESRGIDFSVVPGQIHLSFLPQYLPLALSIMQELVMKATLDAHAFTMCKAQLIAQFVQLVDTPSQYINSLAKKIVYQQHPYAKSPLGTFETLKNLTLQQIQDAYITYLHPAASRLVIVGALDGYDVEKLCRDYFGQWQPAHELPTINFPEVSVSTAMTYDYEKARDQIVLMYVGKSVDRFDQEYDALLLYDQIFDGGVLGPMPSRLFDIREQTGLFYTIVGKLVAGADEQPGMVLIRTIVSPDKLAQAQEMIEKVINETPVIAPEQLQQARNAIMIGETIFNGATLAARACTLLQLDVLGLPDDYFCTHAQKLAGIDEKAVIDAVQKVLNTHYMATLRMGRLRSYEA